MDLRGGIARLGERLLARTDATVERSTRVGSVVRDRERDREDGADRWTLLDAESEGVGEGEGEREELGTFDALLLTPPAPQTAGLLSTMSWDDSRRPPIYDAAAAVEYASVVTAVLHYPFELDPPWYALVDTGGDHAVGWLAREECKDGHVPDGESLLVAQMGRAWSAERIDDDPGRVVGEATDHVAGLLDDERLADPDWTDYRGWRYALPRDGIEGDAHRACEDAGLYVAGDWVVGEGRLHAALKNGLEVGERIADGR